MPINLEFLVQRLGDLFEEERGTQAKRESGGITALKDAIKQFGPGYGSGLEAKAKASATAGAIGSGLGGTTRPAAISAGLSGEFEDMRRGRMATAQTNLANFLGSYRDPTAVTPGTLTHAATGGFGGMLKERMAVEQANQQVREQNRLNRQGSQLPTLGGGGYGGGGGSIWDTTSLGSSGGDGGSRTGATSAPYGYWDEFSYSGDQQSGNLLGDFNPEAANLRLGNTPQSDAGLQSGGWRHSDSSQVVTGPKPGVDYDEWAAGMSKLGWSQTA